MRFEREREGVVVGVVDGEEAVSGSASATEADCEVVPLEVPLRLGDPPPGGRLTFSSCGRE